MGLGNGTANKPETDKPDCFVRHNISPFYMIKLS